MTGPLARAGPAACTTRPPTRCGPSRSTGGPTVASWSAPARTASGTRTRTTSPTSGWRGEPSSPGTSRSTAAVVAAQHRQVMYHRLMGVSPNRVRNREIATAFLAELNARTVCQVCGGQPIEWHHEDHPGQPNARVSSLRTQGLSLERIQREIDRCTPLCRSCHMREDGRLVELLKRAPRQAGMVLPSGTCSDCGREFKPLRRGRCFPCYQREFGQHWRGRAS